MDRVSTVSSTPSIGNTKKVLVLVLPILLKVLLTTLSIVVHSLQFNTNDS